MDENDVRQLVKEHYGDEARRVLSGAAGCCASGHDDPVSSDLYGEAEREAVPAEALQASLGCGNPAALADLRPGEVVLDLGSGGGIDVLLSARRVGPAGRAYGLDMTDEMLTLAEENKKRAGLENAEFVKGEIEDIPLPDGSIDVIISNCVINLSADKDQVLREAFRVLRAGGRFAVSDIVVRGPVPAELRQDAGLWAGCFAGALEESDYRARLEAAGFAGIEIQPVRVFAQDEAHDFLAAAGLDADRLAPQVAGKVISAFVRAVKP